jgi:hypothetical protein
MPDQSLLSPVLECSALLAWGFVGAVALSGSNWPHTGTRGNVERAALFFVVAALTRATLTEHRTRWQLLAFVLAAIAFEVGRGWTVRRSNGAVGSLASTTGAVAGAVLLRHVAHVHGW